MVVVVRSVPYNQGYLRRMIDAAGASERNGIAPEGDGLIPRFVLIDRPIM